jgi:hypothetical protein
VVCGRRRERFPEQSFYNRLADMEWETPVGEVKSCGGDAMIRAEAFKMVGGFEASIAAGEEPELCRRLRAKNWTILRMNFDMTLHDSAMHRFGQWWRRGIRSGYGALDVETRFPATDPAAGPGPFARQILSTRLWGIGWPAATLVAMLLTRWTFGHAAGWIVFALFALALPAQIARIAWRIRDRVAMNDALRFGGMILLNKFAHVVGQAWYVRDRMIGRGARLIEYKRAGTTPLFAEGGNAIVRWLFGPEFSADLARYPRRAFLREQSIWAVMIYRFGRRNDQRRPGAVRFIGNAIYWPAYRFTETLLGITLPKTTEIGPGFRIYHFGTWSIRTLASAPAAPSGTALPSAAGAKKAPRRYWKMALIWALSRKSSAISISAEALMSARWPWCWKTSRQAPPPWAIPPASSRPPSRWQRLHKEPCRHIVRSA